VYNEGVTGKRALGLAMLSSSSQFRKLLSIGIGLWFAAASCALGCAQVIVPANLEDAAGPLPPAAFGSDVELASDLPSCHQGHQQHGDSPKKAPQPSSSLSCCPLDATPAVKSIFSLTQQTTTSTLTAALSPLSASSLSQGLSFDPPKFKNARDTYLRLLVFRI
jgi:hypothetical protein